MTPEENGVPNVETTATAIADPAPAPDAASTTPASPLTATPPAFSNRELRIGATGLGIGLVVGVVGSLLAASVAGGIGSIAMGSPMTDAAATCEIESNPWITVGDEGRSVSMKSEGGDSAGADFEDLACVLLELDTPDSVISRIDSTRALDGRQTGTWDGFSASWGYHPDNGLDIVIELAAD
jgi:hypothetical protein